MSGDTETLRVIARTALVVDPAQPPVMPGQWVDLPAPEAARLIEEGHADLDPVAAAKAGPDRHADGPKKGKP